MPDKNTDVIQATVRKDLNLTDVALNDSAFLTWLLNDTVGKPYDTGIFEKIKAIDKRNPNNDLMQIGNYLNGENVPHPENNLANFLEARHQMEHLITEQLQVIDKLPIAEKEKILDYYNKSHKQEPEIKQSTIYMPDIKTPNKIDLKNGFEDNLSASPAFFKYVCENLAVHGSSQEAYGSMKKYEASRNNTYALNHYNEERLPRPLTPREKSDLVETLYLERQATRDIRKAISKLSPTRRNYLMRSYNDWVKKSEAEARKASQNPSVTQKNVRPISTDKDQFVGNNYLPAAIYPKQKQRVLKPVLR
jgi:hypothetical protein